MSSLRHALSTLHVGGVPLATGAVEPRGPLLTRSAAAAATYETDTLVPTSLLNPEWDSYGAVSRAPIRLATVNEGGNGTTDVYVNYGGDGPLLGLREVFFVAPPGATAVTITLVARQAVGFAGQIVRISVNNEADSDALATQLCALTDTFDTFSVTYASAVPGTQYRVQFLANFTTAGTTFEARAIVRSVKVTAAGATGVLAAPYLRVGSVAANLRADAVSPVVNTSHPFPAQCEFAEIAVRTVAGSVAVEHFCDFVDSQPTHSDFVATLDGVVIDSWECAVDGALTFRTITVPSAGVLAVRRCGVNSTLKGAVRALYLPASAGTPRRPPPLTGPVIYCVGDSITGGLSASVPPRTSWTQLLRDQHGAATYVTATGGIGYGTVAGGTTFYTDAAGRCAPTLIWVALGTNDWAANTTLATFAAQVATVLDALHAAAPTATVYVASPLTRGGADPGNNTNGDSLDAFRSALSTACGTRAWSVYVNTKTWLTTAVMPDLLHPDDTGHATYATNAAAALGLP